MQTGQQYGTGESNMENESLNDKQEFFYDAIILL